MQFADIAVLIGVLTIISILSFVVSSKKNKAVKTTRDTILGSGVGVLSSTLALCSTFISAVSILGFPAEIYYQGGMMIWFIPMYCISFPIVSFVFLPRFYNLKVVTLYEYFETRFNYPCRLATTVLFCVQNILYNAVVVYAPSLAITSLSNIPIWGSIFLTAFLSAGYIVLGGVRAGVFASAAQMSFIFLVMGAIIGISLKEIGLKEIWNGMSSGKRLILDDFRLNPTVRHSVWSLLIGGTGNILALFAANQLSVQRYMAMPTLKLAQKMVLLNILFQSLTLISYVLIGSLIYAVYKDCHPSIHNKNKLVPRFVMDFVSQHSPIPGILGAFVAAVYCAGISTLSQSYTAISAIMINDIWKVYREHRNQPPLQMENVKFALKVLPLFLAVLSIGLAFVCSMVGGIILQISFIVFGAVGGPVLGSFVVGLFIPKVKGNAALIGLIVSVVVSFGISIGSVVLKVTPIPLDLGQCSNQTISQFDESTIGLVTSIPLVFGLDRLFAVSYQYYGVIAVIVNVAVSFAIQQILDWCSPQPIERHSQVPLETPLLTATKHDPEHRQAQVDTLA